MRDYHGCYLGYLGYIRSYLKSETEQRQSAPISEESYRETVINDFNREKAIMKPCPVLLAVKNNRILAIPDCHETCILRIKGQCLLRLITEFLRRLIYALTEK